MFDVQGGGVGQVQVAVDTEGFPLSQGHWSFCAFAGGESEESEGDDSQSGSVLIA
jgi:hypothetical protein